MTEETIDWENNGIFTMLHSAMYANALCTCVDEASPCALHAREAFKVWLYAIDIGLVNHTIDCYMVSHMRGSEPEGMESLPPQIAKAFYYGRIPWRLTLYPRARRLAVGYFKASGLTDSTSWFELRSKAHDYDRTHTCNLTYVQFVMAMHMPRPCLSDDAEPGDLVPTFNEVRDLDTAPTE